MMHRTQPRNIDSGDTTMLIYKVLSLLLDYPDSELQENLDAMTNIVSSESELSPGERSELLQVIRWMRSESLIELQARYVETFDLTAEHSLHLTHHTFGDSRERGPALVELGEFYKTHGLEASPGELPDYLPLILEYAATLDELEARMFLGDTAKVLEGIASSLEKKQSPYAPLIRTVERHGHLARSAA